MATGAVRPGRFCANVSMSISLEALAGISPAPVCRALRPSPREAPSDPGDPASPPSPLEGRPADGARGSCGAPSPRQPETDAAVPRRRAGSLRTAARRDRAGHRRLGAGRARGRRRSGRAPRAPAAAVSAHGTAPPSGPRKVAKLVGEADSACCPASKPSMASLGPVTGLARLARGEIDRDTFTRQYGHRGPHEVELSIPRHLRGQDPQPGRCPPRHRPRCRHAAGGSASGPRCGLSGWHARTPTGRGAQGHCALGPGRPRPRSGQIRGREVGVGSAHLGAARRQPPVTAMTCSSWSCQIVGLLRGDPGPLAVIPGPAGPPTRPTRRYRRALIRWPLRPLFRGRPTGAATTTTSVPRREAERDDTITGFPCAPPAWSKAPRGFRAPEGGSATARS